MTTFPPCSGAGPYTSSRPGSGKWMAVGVTAVKDLATWITRLEQNVSMAGVVSALEVVNEPGLVISPAIIKIYDRTLFSEIDCL